MPSVHYYIITEGGNMSEKTKDIISIAFYVIGIACFCALIALEFI